MSRQNALKTLNLVAVLGVVVMFNNCGEGFKSLQFGANFQSLLSPTPAPTSPSQSPSPAISPSPASSNSPATSPSQIPDISPNPTITPSPEPISESFKARADSLAPGEWLELPATNRIIDVSPPSSMVQSGTNFRDAAGAVIPWSGGAVGQGQLLVWGGGHDDYAGNEVYAFDFDTLKWSRLTDPSPYSNPECKSHCSTVDGTLTSVHSYDGIEYLPQIGKFWMGPGSIYENGGGTNQAALFDIRTKTWQRIPNNPIGGYCASDFDPVSGKLIITNNSGRLAVYDPVANEYQNVTDPNWSAAMTGAFDYHRRQFIVLSNGRPNAVYRFNLASKDLVTDKSPFHWAISDFQTTYRNGEPFRPYNNDLAGFVYHPTEQKFVGWNGDRTVWVLNPVDWSWTELQPKGSGPNTSNITRGVYGRWRYLPQYDVFIGYNDPNGNPWIYKLP